MITVLRILNLLLWKLRFNRFLPFQETLLDKDKYNEWRRKDALKDLELLYRLGIELRNKDVMDFGCGLGGKSRMILGQGVHHLYAVDLSAEDLTVASMYLADYVGQGIASLVQGQSMRIDLPDDSIDVILALDVLEHIEHLQQVFNEMLRILHPNGVLFFKYQPFEAPFAHHAARVLLVPWCHLLLPFDALDSLVQTARQDVEKMRGWNNFDRLPYINCKKVGAIKQAFYDAGFRVVNFEYIGFEGKTTRIARTVSQVISKSHGLRPYFTSICYGACVPESYA